MLAMQKRIPPADKDVHGATRVQDLGEQWYREEVAASTKKAANTKARYRQVLDKYVNPGMGGLRIDEVTTASVGRFLRRVEDSTGPTTARTVRSVLSGMFTLAVAAAACERNPVRDVARIEVAPVEVRAMTTAEVQALRAAVRADEWACSVDLPALLDMLLATGCRVGEALALRWEDVDLDAGTVTLSGTVVRDGEAGLVRQPFTKGKKPRTVRLNESVVASLAAKDRLHSPDGPRLVFPSSTLGLREVTTVDRQWRRFRERHPEFGWVNLHTVRKTVATTIERADGLTAASAVLGHTRPTVTSKHYVEASGKTPDVTSTLDVLFESAG